MSIKKYAVATVLVASSIAASASGAILAVGNWNL